MPNHTQSTVTVVLASALLRLFPDARTEQRVSAATVGEMIDALDALWPGMRDRISDSTPRIRPHMNVFVDGRRADLRTTLASDTTVYVFTAISGG